MTNSLLLDLPIEFVDLPITFMVIFHSKLLVYQSVRRGKSSEKTAGCCVYNMLCNMFYKLYYSGWDDEGLIPKTIQTFAQFAVSCGTMYIYIHIFIFIFIGELQSKTTKHFRLKNMTRVQEACHRETCATTHQKVGDVPERKLEGRWMWPIFGDFHRHRGTPTAGWFTRENTISLKWMSTRCTPV